MRQFILLAFAQTHVLIRNAASTSCYNMDYFFHYKIYKLLQANPIYLSQAVYNKSLYFPEQTLKTEMPETD